jgi:predicted nucleotidyltransferase
MKRNQVITLLKRYEPEFHDAGIGALFLFGSVARDEAREVSDIDLFLTSNARRASPCSISWRFRNACKISLEPKSI